MTAVRPVDLVDPQLQPGIPALAPLAQALRTMSVPEVRAMMAEAAQAAASSPEPPLPSSPLAGIHTEDVVMAPAAGSDEDELRLRVYRPDAPGPLPGLVYLHSGGMILGDLDAEDGSARSLAALGVVVVSVDYRLAPEHPDPAPIEDAYRGLLWLAAHVDDLGVDPGRLAVAGASAGGGLAAGVALLARDRGGPELVAQILAYPMLDDTGSTASSRRITDLGIWDRDVNEIAWTALLGGRIGTEQVSPYAAPARATDLTGLPPAVLLVGDLDLFLDETLAYAARLIDAGVPTELHVYPGAYHAFDLVIPDADVSRRLVDDRDQAVRRLLARPDRSS